MGTIGPRLRAAREARNLSTEQAADDTRISLRFIEALEREEFDALPAPVYVRGFLRSYANYLGLEPQTLLDDLNGANAAEAMPAPYVRGPDRRATRPTPVPMRREPAPEPVAPVPHDPESEWDPEPDDDDVYEYEDEPAGDYRARPVPGVLVERAYSENDGGTARTVMLAGIAIIIVVVALFAAVALRGGGGNTPGTGGDDDSPTPTEADANAGKTVITVASPTIAGTAPAEGTVAGTTVPADGTDPTNTPTGGNTPSAGATDTPAANATATNTPQPTATATPTNVPPTPTPSPTPVVHPLNTQECPRASNGQVDCGTGELLVICGPNGWFIDYGRDYPNNEGWNTFGYTGYIYELNGYAASACS